jgi:hypothetical protein
VTAGGSGTLTGLVGGGGWDDGGVGLSAARAVF